MTAPVTDPHPSPAKPGSGASAIPARCSATRPTSQRAGQLAIFVADADGRVQAWSPAAASITGYAAADIVGKPVSLLYTLESVRSGQPDSDFADARLNGSTHDAGWRIRNDGRMIWTDMGITALKDAAGSVAGFACSLRDLTEVEAAEARKRARAERLAALTATQRDIATLGFDIAVLLPRIVARACELASAEAAVIELKEGTGDRARSHAGRALFDLALSDLLAPQGGATSGATLKCLRHDPAHESPEIRADACAEHGVGALMAIPLLHDRATIGWLAVLSGNPSAFDDERASTIEMLATLLGGALAQAQGHDAKRALAAERTRAHAAQRDSDARFHAAMDASLDALFIAVAIRGADGAIVDFRLQGANRRALQLCDLAADELVGQHLTDLPEVSRHLGTIAKLAAVVESRSPVEQERESLHGPRRWWIQEQIVPLEDGVTITLRDVTARVRADAEVRRAREVAEAASRAKSDFVARMSHELRTPLNSVIGFANILRRNKRNALDATELGYLQRVNSAGTHLLALINNVLDLSKVEAGHMALDMEVVDLSALLRNVVALLDPVTVAPHVTLRMDVPDGDLSIRADSGKMQQVLLNVIGNALKFTPAGVVTVRVGTVKATHGGALVVTQIEVEDTGIGIPADRLHAVFEAFEQGESFTSRRYGGTGLGLAISRALCEAMGFALDVESVFGMGTTFRINLQPPRAAARTA